MSKTKDCPGEKDCLELQFHLWELQARMERNRQAELAGDPECGEKKMTI